MPNVVVVGGGAAGIFAAWRAASLGAQVTLVEKTSRLGTKILISGGGKCNVAHAGEMGVLLRAFRPNEAGFIRPACYRLRNTQIVDMLTERGLQVYTRPDGRIFPVDQNAKDVVAILRGYLEEVGVRVLLDAPVEEVLASEGKIHGVRIGAPFEAKKGYREPVPEHGYGAGHLLKTVMAEAGAGTRGSAGELACDRLVLAAGGSSYPNSGTTGDGWTWARALGHTIVKTRAALAPIYMDPEPAQWSGVAIRDCTLRARQNNKEIAKWTGDFLFTHQGVSGPNALGISRIVAENLGGSPIVLEVDILPAKTFEDVTSDLMTYATSNPRRSISTLVAELVPERLVPAILSDAEIPSDLIGAKLDKKSRNRLANTLKAWAIGAVRTVPLEKGEVVAGGVSLQEVDNQTMASKLVKGLYLCGEMLDIAGPVGGYNLQAAFATGYVAGESAARDASYSSGG